MIVFRWGDLPELPRRGYADSGAFQMCQSTISLASLLADLSVEQTDCRHTLVES